MKRLNAWINRTAALVPLLEACDAQPWFQPRPNSRGGVAFAAVPGRELLASCPAGFPADRWVALHRMLRAEGAEGYMEYWAHAGLFSSGVKVYAPTGLELVALSQVDPRLTVGGYRQPFDTFAVAFPDDFSPRPVSADVGVPAGVVTRYDHRTRCYAMVVVGSGPRSLVSQMSLIDPPETELADVYDSLPWEADTDSAERELMVFCRTVALNVAALLTHYGARRIGPANPEYDARLRAALAKKSLPPAVRAANERELRKLPTLYGFDQHVRVYEREGGPPHGGGSGPEVKPHWRRGHWAHQPCGPGRAERRLVFRPAVMVNAHRFGGRPADTRVTMTTA